MSDEIEDEGDVSAYDPFKGYGIIETFFDNIDKFSTYTDDGDAESGPSLSRDFDTRGLKKAIQATCASKLISPRDFLNLLRRTTYKTAPWPPGEEDRHEHLKSMLRWISDTVRSIERSELRQELSFYESVDEEEDFGSVADFEAPGSRVLLAGSYWPPRFKELVASIPKDVFLKGLRDTSIAEIDDKFSQLLGYKNREDLTKRGFDEWLALPTYPDFHKLALKLRRAGMDMYPTRVTVTHAPAPVRKPRRSILESDEVEGRGDVSSFPEPNWRANPHAEEIVAFLTDMDYPEPLIEELAKAVIESSIDDEDGMDLYDPDSIEETFAMYAPQSAEEFRDAHSKVVLAMYESVEEEDIGEVSQFGLSDARYTSIANAFMNDVRKYGLSLALEITLEDTPKDILFQSLAKTHKSKMIKRIKKITESEEEDAGDVSNFPKPETNPIIAHCGVCGAPIGANGPVIDIPEDYDPDDYPRDDICDDCLRREEHRYIVTRDMALDAGDPDLEGTEW